MILSGHQPNYLPYAGLIGKIMNSDKFIYVSEVQFERKSWQNRNRIRGINGEILLTIPVKTKGLFNQKISEVKINNNLNWKEKHFMSIDLNYKKSKYYNDYIGFFKDLYNREWEYLNEIDIYIMNWILEVLDIDTKIYYDTDFEFQGKKTEYLIEMCKELNCNTYLSNRGSENYVRIDLFNEVNLNHRYIEYLGEEYFQRGKSFIENLSIIDMLFNIGPIETKKILENIKNYKFSLLNERL